MRARALRLRQVGVVRRHRRSSVKVTLVKSVTRCDGISVSNRITPTSANTSHTDNCQQDLHHGGHNATHLRLLKRDKGVGQALHSRPTPLTIRHMKCLVVLCARGHPGGDRVDLCPATAWLHASASCLPQSTAPACCSPRRPDDHLAILAALHQVVVGLQGQPTLFPVAAAVTLHAALIENRLHILGVADGRRGSRRNFGRRWRFGRGRSFGRRRCFSRSRCLGRSRRFGCRGASVGLGPLLRRVLRSLWALRLRPGLSRLGRCGRRAGGQDGHHHKRQQ